jgi:hypothetical protein
MRHSNQIGIFWQVEIRAINLARSSRLVDLFLPRMLCSYFCKVCAMKFNVRFHASAVSSARYPSLLLGFSKP